VCGGKRGGGTEGGGTCQLQEGGQPGLQDLGMAVGAADEARGKQGQGGAHAGVRIGGGFRGGVAFGKGVAPVSHVEEVGAELDSQGGNLEEFNP